MEHQRSEMHLNESTILSSFEAFKKIEMRISLKNERNQHLSLNDGSPFASQALIHYIFFFYIVLIDIGFCKK